MGLERPSLAILGLIIAAIFLIGAKLARKYRLSASAYLQPKPLAYRGAVLALLLIALSGPYYLSQRAIGSVIALLDVSESLDESLGQKLLDRLQTLGQQTVVRVLPFTGSSASFSLPLNEATSFRRLKTSWAALDLGHSNLAQALRAGMASGSSSLLLISDGQENADSAASTLPEFQRAQVKIFPLTPELGQEQAPRLKIVNLNVPLLAPNKKSAALSASIENTTAAEQTGQLIIRHGDKTIYDQTVNVGANSELVVRAESDASLEGINPITATFTPRDPSLTSSSETAYLAGEEREKVLLLSGNEEERRVLDRIYSSQSYQLTSLVAPGKFESLPPFEGFSAVIFNNLSAAQLPAGALSKIEQYVNSGGGFLMIGGNKSFGLGGYLNTPIDKMLPLQSLPPQGEQRRLSTAVELVIDKSNSMGADQKLDFAKEAAREVVRNLKDDDFVGVIGFDDRPFEVVPLDLVARNRQPALTGIGRLFSAHSTNFYAALIQAQNRLEGVQAGRKHIIALTDGKIPDANLGYIERVKQARFLGITISTVMVGYEPDFGFLQGLADVGGGSYYQTESAVNLPRIFLDDLKVTTGERTMQEQQEFLVRYGTAPLESTSTSNFPTLKGFVETRPKDNAKVELNVLAQGKLLPLLASWRYGAGRALAFTSDASGRWSANWLIWPQLAQFWSDLIDALRPENAKAGARIPFDLRHYVEHGELVLDLSVFSDLSQEHLRAALNLPDNNKRELDFVEVAKGRYQARLSNPLAGKYEVRIFGQAHSLTPVAIYLSGEQFGEHKGAGFNLPLLEKLAQASLGKMNPKAKDLEQELRYAPETHSLAPMFALLALLFLCLEIFSREVPTVRRR